MLGPFPNPHAVLVHFPIALLVIAVLLDGAGLWKRDLRRPAAMLFVIGALFLIPTFLAGQRAGDMAKSPIAGMQKVLGEHQDLATWTLWFFLAYAAARAFLEFRPRVGTGLRSAAWVLSLVGLGLLVETGLHGGELVYRMGVGVRPAIELARGEESSRKEARAPEVAENGLQRQLHAALGSEPRYSGAGDTLVIAPRDDSPTVLLEQGEQGSVEIEADVELDDFDGSFGFVHHAAGGNTFDYGRVDSAIVEMGRWNQGREQRAASEPVTRVAGWHSLHLVSSGHHWRMYRDEKLLVHTHVDEAPRGQVGLWIRGAGKIAIRDLRVRPL